MSQEESETRFKPTVSWRDFFIVAGVIAGFGAAQTQIVINSRRLDRIEQQGSPQLSEFKSMSEERDKRLSDLVAAHNHRLDLLDGRVAKAIENAENVHGSQESHLHAVDQRLDRMEQELRDLLNRR